jgi:hypothetical protein
MSSESAARDKRDAAIAALVAKTLQMDVSAVQQLATDMSTTTAELLPPEFKPTLVTAAGAQSAASWVQEWIGALHYRDDDASAAFRDCTGFATGPFRTTKDSKFITGFINDPYLRFLVTSPLAFVERLWSNSVPAPLMAARKVYFRNIPPRPRPPAATTTAGSVSVAQSVQSVSSQRVSVSASDYLELQRLRAQRDGSVNQSQCDSGAGHSRSLIDSQASFTPSLADAASERPFRDPLVLTAKHLSESVAEPKIVDGFPEIETVAKRTAAPKFLNMWTNSLGLSSGSAQCPDSQPQSARQRWLCPPQFDAQKRRIALKAEHKDYSREQDLITQQKTAAASAHAITQLRYRFCQSLFAFGSQLADSLTDADAAAAVRDQLNDKNIESFLDESTTQKVLVSAMAIAGQSFRAATIDRRKLGLDTLDQVDRDNVQLIPYTLSELFVAKTATEAPALLKSFDVLDSAVKTQIAKPQKSKYHHGHSGNSSYSGSSYGSGDRKRGGGGSGGGPPSKQPFRGGYQGYQGYQGNQNNYQQGGNKGGYQKKGSGGKGGGNSGGGGQFRYGRK